MSKVVNEVEYSRVHIFYVQCFFFQKNIFFANLLGNIKLQVFPKLRLSVGNPKVWLINVLRLTNCSTDYKTGQKKASLHFHEDKELKPKQIFFVNRKDWLPKAHSVICIDHFEEKFIKRDKKCQLLCCGKYI